MYLYEYMYIYIIGRGISLPAGGVAGSRLCTMAVGGYARVRKQFKVPIAEMEGVQEKLSNIGMITYQVYVLGFRVSILGLVLTLE